MASVPRQSQAPAQSEGGDRKLLQHIIKSEQLASLPATQYEPATNVRFSTGSRIWQSQEPTVYV